jgi:hypothetical protein
MMFYTYRLSTKELAAKLPSGTGLEPLLVGTLQVVETAVAFPAVLSPNDKLLLDQFMADKGWDFYAELPVVATFHASTKLVESEAALGADWTPLGGVVTDPHTFAKNVDKVFASLVGGVRTTGLGAELRMVQIAAGVETVLGTVALPDTLSSWATFQGYTNIPPSGGLNTYRVEGRSGSASSASVRFISATLLESL